MGRLLDAVAAFLAAREWPADAVGDRISFPAFGDNGTWTTHVTAHEDRQLLLVHSVLDHDVPAERLPELAEYLTRANFGLVLGNFELDLADGELRYKTSLEAEEIELTERVVDNLVSSNLATVDRYLPGIRAVAAGTSPADALAAVEG